MKMKCSVIQDLMPSYVDEICSQDSRELVQEHVAECEQCKAKLEQMKNTHIVAGSASKKQVDYLKKIRTNILRKEWLGKFMMVILVFIEVGGVFSGRGSLINFQVETGILFSLALMCGAGLAGNYGFSEKRKSAAVEICISAIGLLLLVLLSEYSTRDLLQGIVPFHLTEMYHVGPFLVSCYRVIIFAEALILFLNTFKKQNNAYATILNIVSLSLASNMTEGLYHMEAPESFQWYVDMSNVSQLVLAVLGIIVCFLFRNRRKEIETKNNGQTLV